MNNQKFMNSTEIPPGKGQRALTHRHTKRDKLPVSVEFHKVFRFSAMKRTHRAASFNIHNSRIIFFFFLKCNFAYSRIKIWIFFFFWFLFTGPMAHIQLYLTQGKHIWHVLYYHTAEQTDTRTNRQMYCITKQKNFNFKVQKFVFFYMIWNYHSFDTWYIHMFILPQFSLPLSTPNCHIYELTKLSLLNFHYNTLIVITNCHYQKSAHHRQETNRWPVYTQSRQVQTI